MSSTLRQLFLNHTAQTSDSPLALEVMSAKGIYLLTPGNRRIIDLISGIGVSNLGHSQPAIVRAVRKQAKKFMHLMVYGEFVQSPQVRLAKQLCDTLPEHLDNVFFVNSGTEAVEGAMKLAKKVTGRTEFISLTGAYHGASHAAMSVGGGEEYKQTYGPLLPDCRQIRLNNWDDLEQISEKTAAVLIETIQGEAGIRIPESNWFQALHSRCKMTGALLILDEIQAGFGRTGKLWAFENYEGVMPDILLTAKALGGGMPLGAFIASRKMMSEFQQNPVLGHITTFGGHPVSCAASSAALTLLKEGTYMAEAEAKSRLFSELLVHPRILEVRAAGLMLAVEFGNFAFLKAVIDRALEKGVLSDWFLYCNTAMRIAPPLIITEKQIRKACRIILTAVEETAAVFEQQKSND